MAFVGVSTRGMMQEVCDEEKASLIVNAERGAGRRQQRLAVVGLFAVLAIAGVSALALRAKGAGDALVAKPAAIVEKYVTSGGPARVQNSNVCIDIVDGTSKVQLWECVDGNHNQQLSLLPSSATISDGRIGRLMWMSNKVTGAKMCLGPPAGSTDNGAQLEVMPCSGAPTFKIPTSRFGQIRFQETPTKCISVNGGVLAAGSTIHVWDCTNTPEQLWNLNNLPSYVVSQIKTGNTDMCLRALNSPSNTPAPVAAPAGVCLATSTAVTAADTTERCNQCTPANSGTCTSCVTTANHPSNGLACCAAGEGFFTGATACAACLPNGNCFDCSSATACTKCNPGFFLHSGSCLTACPTGTTAATAAVATEGGACMLEALDTTVDEGPCGEDDTKFITPEGGRPGLVRWMKDSSLCLDIGELEAGNPLQLIKCIDGGHKNQLFLVPAMGESGQVKVADNTTYCVEAKADPGKANGYRMVSVECSSADTAAQTFTTEHMGQVMFTTTNTVSTPATVTGLPADGSVVEIHNVNGFAVAAPATAADTNPVQSIAPLTPMPGRSRWIMRAVTPATTPASYTFTLQDNSNADGLMLAALTTATAGAADTVVLTATAGPLAQWRLLTPSGAASTVFTLQNANTGTAFYLSGGATAGSNMNLAASALLADTTQHFSLTTVFSPPTTMPTGDINLQGDTGFVTLDGNDVKTPAAADGDKSKWTIAVPEATKPNEVTLTNKGTNTKLLTSAAAAAGAATAAPATSDATQIWRMLVPTGAAANKFVLQSTASSADKVFLTDSGNVANAPTVDLEATGTTQLFSQ